MLKNIIVIMLLLISQFAWCKAQHLDEGLEVLVKGVVDVLKRKIKDKDLQPVEGQKSIRIGIKGFYQNGKYVKLSKEIESKFSETLINKLSGVQVIERSAFLLEIAKKELQTQNTDFYFDKSSAREIGRISPIDVIIFGEITVDKTTNRASISATANDIQSGNRVAFKRVVIYLHAIQHLLATDFPKKNPLIVKAESGDTEAMHQLATNYEKGTNGFLQDYKLMQKWDLKAAELGHPISQFYVGGMYYYGEYGVDKDIQTAIKWYEKAAYNGDLESIYALIDHFGTKGDERKVIKYATLGAKKDDLDSTRELILAFARTKNFEQGYVWAQKIKSDPIAKIFLFGKYTDEGRLHLSIEFGCSVLRHFIRSDDQMMQFIQKGQHIIREELAELRKEGEDVPCI